MFTLNVNMHEVNSMLFTHGKRSWRHWNLDKQVHHVNLTFKVDGETKILLEVMPKVCETCQLGKQVKHQFLAQKLM